MDKGKKIVFKVPPPLIDPAQIRARKIQEEAEERFNNIADQILEILKKENVLVSEIPRVVSSFSNKINTKIDNASVDSVLKLL